MLKGKTQVYCVSIISASLHATAMQGKDMQISLPLGNSSDIIPSLKQPAAQVSL